MTPSVDTIFTLRDGLVAEVHYHADPAEALEAAGLTTPHKQS